MLSPDLAGLQALLGRAFRSDQPLAESALASEVAAVVRPSPRMTPIARADVYREQYWCRHLESLEEDLPTLARFLGAQAFDAFVRAYLVACPPRSWTLRHLTDRLVSFAEGYRAFPDDKAHACRELIRFELSCYDAFDAPDESDSGVSPLHDLATAAPERFVAARLVFQPSLSVATYQHPVNEARAAVKRGERGEIALPRRRTHVAVWRCPRTIEVKHRALGDEECALLGQLMAGQPVGQALLVAATKTAAVRRWFEGFGRRGWITAVALPPTLPPT